MQNFMTDGRGSQEISRTGKSGSRMKLSQRFKDGKSQVVTFCHELKLTAVDRKLRETDCANAEGIFHIIQSIPSRRGVDRNLQPPLHNLLRNGGQKTLDGQAVYRLYPLDLCIEN